MAELPERLREAADAHRPDRARMLARVERAMTASGPHGEPGADGPRGEPPGRPDRLGAPGGREHPPAPWVRVTAVAAAVAGAIGLGGLAVGAVSGGGGSHAPAGRPAGPAATATRPPGGSGASGASTGRPKAPAAPGHGTPGTQGADHTSGRTPVHGATGPSAGASSPAGTGGAGSGSPPAAQKKSSGVTSRAAVDPGSNPYWTQEDITLTTSRPLTSLTVELRVVMTQGVGSTGQFDSFPGQSAATTTVEGGDLVYRWTLDPGQTLAAGTYTFAGQFNHAQGARDTRGDRYTVTANGPGGSVSTDGGF